MESSFKQIEDYWSKKGAADATGFAKQARVASADVAKAAAAGDFDAAGAALTVVGGTCGGCHMAHRAKGDSGFQIK
jgi:cytochrome c556